MRLKKYQNGGRPSPSNRDAIPQYSSMYEYMSLSPYERGGSGAVENTFGPEDYILGAFPLARALSPAARAIGKYLGLGRKAAPAASTVKDAAPVSKLMDSFDDTAIAYSPNVNMQRLARPQYTEAVQLGRTRTEMSKLLQQVSDLTNPKTSFKEKTQILKDFGYDGPSMSFTEVNDAVKKVLDSINKYDETAFDDALFRDPVLQRRGGTSIQAILDQRGSSPEETKKTLDFLVKYLSEKPSSPSMLPTSNQMNSPMMKNNKGGRIKK